MNDANIAKFSKEDQDKIAVDLVASAVAWKERMNMPVVPEVVVREQPEHLREYFMERVRHYRQLSISCRTVMIPDILRWPKPTKSSRLN